VAKRGEFYKFAPGAVAWLWKHVAEFDVVHIHALFSFVSNAAALICRLRGVPYIVRPLGTLNSWGVTNRRPWLKRLSLAAIEGPILSHAAFVHFTSDAEVQEAQALRIPFRAAVVPLGVAEPPARQHGSAEWSGALPQGRDYILFLSRIDPKKNLETLLDAFAILRAEFPAVPLVIAGDGRAGYVEQLRQKAKSLGVDEDIVWTGHIDGARKWDTLRGARVFVLPSFSENFGIAAAEALIAGVPCVLAHGVAVAADVARAGAGIAVNPDAPSVASAVGELLRDAAMHARMAERARALGMEQYSAATMASRVSQLYAQAGESGRRHALP
jgi:glycosyltransferase involved in cell wall biosynthesis